MKVIISGTRTVKDKNIVPEAVQESGFEITEVVSGGAPGVDFFGEVYANYNKIPLKVFPAKWVEHGNKAGILRNIEMAKYADALIAIWDGHSKGTAHMIDIAKRNNLKVYIHIYKDGA